MLTSFTCLLTLQFNIVAINPVWELITLEVFNSELVVTSALEMVSQSDEKVIDMLTSSSKVVASLPSGNSIDGDAISSSSDVKE